MTKEMICISCPMGCMLTVVQEADGEVRVTGNTCKRGETYGRQEMTCPMRVVTSLVRLEGGARPICSCKTRQPIPKAKIPQALEEIAAQLKRAPLRRGDVVIADVAGTGVDVIATSDIAAR